MPSILLALAIAGRLISHAMPWPKHAMQIVAAIAATYTLGLIAALLRRS